MEFAANSNPEVQKRRSSRIVQAVPLTVSGVDALGRPFQERTSTLIINCHGCRYQSKHYVLKNMWVTLEVPHPEPGHEPRSARGRVMWIQRPRTVRELFQVGVELEVPGNLWGIAFAPPDWFPFPDDATAVPAPAAVDTGVAAPEPPALAWSNTAEAAPAEDNLPDLPTLPIDDTMEMPALFAQMPQLVSEAKQQLFAAALQERAAAEAAAAQERSAAAETLADSQVLHDVVARAEQASEAQLNTLRERWHRELDDSAAQAGDRASQRFEEIASQCAAAFEAQLETRLQHAMENAEHAAQNFTARLAKAQENLDRFDQQTGDSAAAALHEMEQRIQDKADHARGQLAEIDEAARQLNERISFAAEVQRASWQSLLESDLAAITERWNRQAGDSAAAVLHEMEQRIQDKADHARGQLTEIDETARKLNEKISSAAEAQRAGWQSLLESDLAAITERWNRQTEAALDAVTQQAAERLNRQSQEAGFQLAQQADAGRASIDASLADARAAAENIVDATRSSLAGETARSQETLRQIQSASQSMEKWSARAAEVAKTAQQELERRAAALVEAESRQLASHAEEAISAWTQRLEPALEMAGRQTVGRLGAELERELNVRLEHASQVLQDLESGTRAAGSIMRSHQETLARTSEREIEGILSRLQEAIGHLEKDFAESGRAATAKWLAEVDAKATETTHTTFESLFKTAEWYEKKVQTQMQAAMDRGIEQAGISLREKAGETCGLFATELDHYSRSFVEHTHDQLEEAGREVLERVGKQSTEMAATSAASLGQQARTTTEAALRDLRNQSAAAIDQAAAQNRQNMDEDGRRFTAQFHATLAQEVQQTVGDAAEELRSHAELAKHNLRMSGEEAERQLRETIFSLSDEAITEYRNRLENASNSWLVTTAAKLTQQSEQQIDSIAHAAEQRLRQTCDDVFAGLGETLRGRMLGLFDSQAGKNTPPAK